MPRRGRHGTRVAPSLVIWLVIVWMLLWGTFDVATAVYGLVVALIVLVLFPLPSHRWNIFRRPWRLAVLAGYVLVDLFGSALRFVADAVRNSGRVSAAIIAVPVLSDVDHIIASAANVVSLAPGKFVLQIDRPGGIWYVYTTGVRAAQDAHKAYDDVVDMQRVVVWAFGDEQEAPEARSRAEEAKRQRDRTAASRPQQPAPIEAVAESEAEARGADADADAGDGDENRREDR
ncbi:multicomponent Na+:H+ antiporter subunit E [Prauserella sediminis]|uniref:Multicomponent Na+:H+ antiporter subunit E n=1 Tax=Prauserella sediminis TaxID=577680 RepID=A0A839Y024_9PSEU|nr:Na+/H+ antiporter subunit E [Prauserella sediminis]MBB3665315.1 multicomponent Na+:H+ antiporter subunit E [Prauserella sediminis]